MHNYSGKASLASLYYVNEVLQEVTTRVGELAGFWTWAVNPTPVVRGGAALGSCCTDRAGAATGRLSPAIQPSREPWEGATRPCVTLSSREGSVPTKIPGCLREAPGRSEMILRRSEPLSRQKAVACLAEEPASGSQGGCRTPEERPSSGRLPHLFSLQEEGGETRASLWRSCPAF